MSNFAADDVSFIAQRLKEIEAEKAAVRQKPEEGVVSRDPIVAGASEDDMGWTCYC